MDTAYKEVKNVESYLWYFYRVYIWRWCRMSGGQVRLSLPFPFFF